MGRAREIQGNLVCVCQQRCFVGVEVVADSIGVIEAGVGRLLDEDSPKLVRGNDIEFSQLPFPATLGPVIEIKAKIAVRPPAA